MARNRSIRHKKKRGKSNLIDVDITSLLDILVILLVFLLKSYNSSGIVIDVPEGIKLPTSKSQSYNNPGVLVQVSKDKIWVDSKLVLSSDNLPDRIYDHGKRRIIPLFNELVKKRETIQNVAKRAKGATKFTGFANLIIDKSIKYSYMKRLMYTCAEAGFKEYKFIVMGEEQ
jgi:biopolymer transport protein ExbD